MREKKTAQPTFIQSLDRGLSILQFVAKSKQPVSLGELAVLIGVDRSSAFRLAHTLRRRGFLACPPGRKEYVLGSSIWILARRYKWSNTLVEVAHRELKFLATEINETAHLAIREGNSALFIDSAHANHVIAVAGQAGELVPLYCTAHGKALLANEDEDSLRKQFGQNPLQRYTPTTITTLKALVRECRTIQKNGYATDDAEFLAGVRCIAAPIHFGSEIIGSIGISAPASRFARNAYPDYAEKVRKVATRIGEFLTPDEPNT
jgi:IclR family acetate operon transcriptional repressor